MKLRQRPHKSPVGVKFKFFDEYSLPFHMGAPPPPPDFQMSNGKRRSDGVKSAHHYNLKIIFQVKKQIKPVLCVHVSWLHYFLGYDIFTMTCSSDVDFTDQ